MLDRRSGRTRSRGALGCLAAAAAGLLVLLLPSGASAATCATDFVVAPTPVQLPYEELLSVDVLSSTSAWAVGQTEIVGKTYDPGLAMHWNGGTWNSIPVPQYGQDSAKLEGVAPISDTDVWATGYTGSLQGQIYDRPLAIHWNGTRWRRFAVPLPSDSHGATLWRSEAVSTDDVWAVGWYHTDRSGRAKTLIVHWDGTSWSLVPSPSIPARNNLLKAVTATGPDEAYAVGYAGGRMLIERWNGASWSIDPTDTFGIRFSLRDVEASPSGRVLAVGLTNRSGTSRGFMLRRRTSGWHRVRLPRIGNSVLDGVAWGSTHAYAVGEARGGPIVLERTGQSWVQRTVATPGGPILEGIGASVDGAVWAVGLRFNANGDARSVAETPCT